MCGWSDRQCTGKDIKAAWSQQHRDGERDMVFICCIHWAHCGLAIECSTSSIGMKIIEGTLLLKNWFCLTDEFEIKTGFIQQIKEIRIKTEEGRYCFQNWHNTAMKTEKGCYCNYVLFTTTYNYTYISIIMCYPPLNIITCMYCYFCNQIFFFFFF